MAKFSKKLGTWYCVPLCCKHPLLLFLLGEGPRYIDLLARSRIESRVIHAGRDGHRRRGEDLDALDLMHPQASPDGRWIAYTRMAQSKEIRRLKL